MELRKEYRFTIIMLSLFAIAIAFLEVVVVIHLRELYYPENIQVIFPIKLFNNKDFIVELCREVATIVMILCVAVLVEKKKILRCFACFVFIFGLWDIFYYIWLKIFINWPVNFAEWDILFLIPWMWLGPWICPVIISLLLVFWGGSVLILNKEISFSPLTLILFISGCVCALATFLQPALSVIIKQGVKGFDTYIPGDFWWWLFIPGLLLMAGGLARTFFLPDKTQQVSKTC